MKKRIVSLFLSLTLLTFTAACGSSAPQETPDSSGEPVSSSQPETSPTPAPTPSPTPTPSPEPTPTPEPDDSCFENSAFLGNSLVSDLYTYAIVPDADYYFKNGLTVRSVFTEAEAGSSTGTPVYEAAVSQHYDKYFLMFGLNELGWSYESVFIDDYRTLIETLQKDEPDAEIYVQSLTPVSKSRSDKNLYGVTNDRITLYNDLLRDLCEELDVPFVDISAAVIGPDGTLPEQAAADGVHLNYEYCGVWVDTLRAAIEK